jgi:DNA-binding NtrC family response regulator
MQQPAISEVESYPLLALWLAFQRPRQHFVVRCEPGRFPTVVAQVAMFGTPPVRSCRLPGRLELPADTRGTLLLHDVAALDITDQIALYDWLGQRATDLRVISVTTAPLAPLVAQGAFLEGLLHRLGAVQFDLTSEECVK